MLLSQASGNLGALGSLASGPLGIKSQADMYVAMLKSEPWKMPSSSASI